MARNVATRPQVIQIGKLLEEAIIRNPDKTCTYKAPWNDELIAKQVGCVVGSVAAIRREIYGNFPHAKTGTGYEPRIAALENQLHDLIAFYNKLIDTLHLNRVGDVKHLKVADTTATGAPTNSAARVAASSQNGTK